MVYILNKKDTNSRMSIHVGTWRRIKSFQFP
nr:MAG TPA: hypothetical protein [Inoviridae sp.]